MRKILWGFILFAYCLLAAGCKAKPSPDSDRDYDGLSDYDEVYVHNTDPEKSDTDMDNIRDDHELILGLNPLNPQTHGVPDNLYVQPQIIPADDMVFSRINNNENPYRLSVEITAAGYAAQGLKVKESGYAYAISNDAMVGTPIELEYSGEYKSMTIKFEIAEDLLDYSLKNEKLNGIERYNIFHFYEDTNMLLPVVTYYEHETDSIYTEIENTGTYCVMDMAKWFTMLNIPIAQ